jgi:hypothetical protein
VVLAEVGTRRKQIILPEAMAQPIQAAEVEGQTLRLLHTFLAQADQVL